MEQDCSGWIRWAFSFYLNGLMSPLAVKCVAIFEGPRLALDSDLLISSIKSGSKNVVATIIACHLRGRFFEIF